MMRNKFLWKFLGVKEEKVIHYWGEKAPVIGSHWQQKSHQIIGEGMKLCQMQQQNRKTLTFKRLGLTSKSAKHNGTAAQQQEAAAVWEWWPWGPHHTTHLLARRWSKELFLGRPTRPSGLIVSFRSSKTWPLLTTATGRLLSVWVSNLEICTVGYLLLSYAWTGMLRLRVWSWIYNCLFRGGIEVNISNFPMTPLFSILCMYSLPLTFAAFTFKDKQSVQGWKYHKLK